MKRALIVLLVLTASATCLSAESPVADDSSVQRAKELFETYVRLEHAFDPNVADLYSDEAVIRNKRTYPTGEVREITIPAPQYKELIRSSMPLAKERGDTSTYTQVTYTAEGDGVRIKADRFSNLKEYHSPVSILVKLAPSAAWLIYEELGESQP